jgi:hypothetical protein
MNGAAHGSADRGIGFDRRRLDANVYAVPPHHRPMPPRAPPSSAGSRYACSSAAFIAAVRAMSRFQYADTHDVAPHLRAGDNVIAVLAHAYGRDMSWYELPRTQWSRALGCGGFYFDSDALGVATGDRAWRCRVAEMERDTPAAGLLRRGVRRSPATEG